jgi:hypothetical protein
MGRIQNCILLSHFPQMYATTDRRMSAWRFVSVFGVGLIVLYRFEMPMIGEGAHSLGEKDIETYEWQS